MPTAAAFRRSCLFLAPVALALLVAGASALPAGSAPAGLVAAYGFDEVGVSTVTDVSGNGNTGTISGAVRSASGRYGGALSFDGDNDLVTIPDASSLDLSNGMTLEAWVRPEALGTSWRTAVVKEQTNALAYALYAHTNYSGPSGHVYTGGADRRARAGALLPLDAWSHVAATYDGSTIRVYRDGTEIATEPVIGTITASSGPLQIGGTQLWSEWFEGMIDEVRVYNRALSVAEIKTDMETRVGSVAPDTTAPGAPTDVVRTTATTTSISMSWKAASDNVGVTEYGLYRNGSKVGVTGSTTGTVNDLACGTTYMLGVDAADAAGNRSAASTISASTAACAGPPNPVPAPRGLVAAYSFDETTGSTVADVSGNGNVGTLAGPSRSASGRYGGALSFDGNDDLVTVADAASLDLTSGMTLEAWVRPSTLGGRWRTILVKEQTDDLAFALYAHTGGRGPSSHVFVSGDDRRARAATAIPAEGWTHVAATYDGATIRVYRNGSVTASQAATGSIATSDKPLRIGGNTVWNEWFHGLIDELRIYDRPLSVAEIAADMQAPLSGTAPAADTTAPVGPGGVTRTGATQTSVSLSWTAAVDDIGVTEYGLYRNGTRSGTSPSTTGTVTGLTCNTTYTLGVDAADAVGNRSAIRTVTASTSACVAADTTPPSTPMGLAVTGATSSSVSLAWTASTDNVGVAGYGVTNGSNWVGTTTTRTYTVPNLACGSTYSLGVDAYDEAGNRSGKAMVSASTGVCSAPPASPPSGSASVYVSSGGSDSAGCSVSAPCRSFDRAYRVARAGEVVEVAAGSYGSQSIGKDAAKTSAADVLFRPAAGATVTLSSLSISGSHVEVRDMRLTTDGSVGSSPIDTRDVTLRNLTGRSLFLRADDTRVIGGSYGGFNACDAGAPEDGVKLWNDSSRGADGIVLDGVTIHDVRRTGCSIHSDCIQIYSGTNHTIKNSTLVNCPTSGIIARPSDSSQKLENITIENNYFGAVLDGSEAINIGTAPDRCSGMVIRYNTVVNESSSFDCLTASGGPGSLVEGNIISVGAGNDATFRNNVFRTGSALVGSSAVQCNPTYRNSAAGDWRLASTDTCARGRGNPTSHPTTDAEGQPRPQGTIDAGADETG